MYQTGIPEIDAILSNRLYQRNTLSVPTVAARMEDNVGKAQDLLRRWCSKSDDGIINAFDSQARADTKEIARILAEKSHQQPQQLPCTEEAFRTFITDVSGLDFETFARTVSPEILQAIELLLSVMGGGEKDGKSEQTYRHVIKVPALAALLAGELYENEQFRDELKTDNINLAEMTKQEFMSWYCAAALLHDFGKIFTPTEILDYDKRLPSAAFEPILETIKTRDIYIVLDGKTEKLDDCAKENVTDWISRQYTFGDSSGAIQTINRTEGDESRIPSILEYLRVDSPAGEQLISDEIRNALGGRFAIRTLGEIKLMHKHVEHSIELVDNFKPLIPSKFLPIITSLGDHHLTMGGNPDWNPFLSYPPDPDGNLRKGKAISALGRLMKFADAVEAASAIRLYRIGLGPEQVNNMVHNRDDNDWNKEAANIFDQDLVGLIDGIRLDNKPITDWFIGKSRRFDEERSYYPGKAFQHISTPLPGGCLEARLAAEATIPSSAIKTLSH